MKPITPSEAKRKRAGEIPAYVFETFNALITSNMRGRTAIVQQDDVLNELVHRRGCARQEVFDKGWLDVEAIYEDAGWQVSYMKPAAYDGWSAHFKFIAPNEKE